MDQRPANSVTVDERMQALSHVLQSRAFARADQLRALLKFLCESEAEGRADISEYVIGREVLGRPEDFSPLADSSVRTRVYELRQKLDKYYRYEGKELGLRIQIAKGGYLPLYERTAVDSPAHSESNGTAAFPAAPHLPETHSPPARRIAPAFAGWIGLALGAGLLVGYFLWSRPAPSATVDPILREAWGPLSAPDANALLCVATPLHLTVVPENHRGRPSYPAPDEAYPLWREHRPLAADAKLGLVFTDNVIGFGTMNSVLTTVKTLRQMGSTFQILPERVAPVSTFRDRNIVLFGAPVDSEAVTRMHEKTPLLVDHEAALKDFVIRDRSSGKTFAPEKDDKGQYRIVYGLVTVFHNRASPSGNVGTVLFSGITSGGTQGAAEYFSSPVELRKLRDKMVSTGLRGFPPAYQVVVRCTFSNMLLLSYEATDFRVLH